MLFFISHIVIVRWYVNVRRENEWRRRRKKEENEWMSEWWTVEGAAPSSSPKPGYSATPTLENYAREIAHGIDIGHALAITTTIRHHGWGYRRHWCWAVRSSLLVSRWNEESNERQMGRVAGVERQEYCVAEAGKRKCRCGCAPLSVKSYYAFVWSGYGVVMARGPCVCADFLA